MAKSSKLAIGTYVTWCEPVNGPSAVGLLMRYGRDVGGVYAEIAHGGERLKIHPSQLHVACKACEARRIAGFDGQCPACANERARSR